METCDILVTFAAVKSAWVGQSNESCWVVLPCVVQFKVVLWKTPLSVTNQMNRFSRTFASHCLFSRNFRKWNLDSFLEFLRISATLSVRLIISLLQTVKRRTPISKYPTKMGTRSNKTHPSEFWTNSTSPVILLGAANLILRAPIIQYFS